jgi:selenide,water dikinase
LPGVHELAARGMVTGASARNWAGYGSEVSLPAGFADEDRALLTDPQTSGGLLVACDTASVDAVLAVFHRHDFAQATVIGGALAASAAPTLRVA